MISIPLIAYALLSASAHVMGNVVGGIFGMAQSAAVTAAGEVSTGNMSFGNSSINNHSFENTSGMTQNTSVAMDIGGASAKMGSGASYNETAGGTGIWDNTGTISRDTVQMTENKAAHHSNDNSISNGMSLNEGEGTRAGKGVSVSFGKNASVGGSR